MIELETTPHDFNPAHFGGIDDFLNSANSNKRDTLMLACPDHGTAPDNVSFAGSDRFFILQHLAASIPSPADSAIDNTFDSIRCGFDGYDIRHVIVCAIMGVELFQIGSKIPSRGTRAVCELGFTQTQ